MRFEAAKQLVHAPAAFPPGYGIDFTDELQVFPHAQVFVEREALGHVTDSLFQRFRIAAGVEPEYVGLAGTWRQQSAKHADGGRFARAVGAEKAVDLAGGNVEIDFVDCHEGAETPGQPARLDRKLIVGFHIPATPGGTWMCR